MFALCHPERPRRISRVGYRDPSRTLRMTGKRFSLQPRSCHDPDKYVGFNVALSCCSRPLPSHSRFQRSPHSLPSLRSPCRVLRPHSSLFSQSTQSYARLIKIPLEKHENFPIIAPQLHIHPRVCNSLFDGCASSLCSSRFHLRADTNSSRNARKITLSFAPVACPCRRGK